MITQPTARLYSGGEVSGPTRVALGAAASVSPGIAGTADSQGPSPTAPDTLGVGQQPSSCCGKARLNLRTHGAKQQHHLDSLMLPIKNG